MDRNIPSRGRTAAPVTVALRKESVDRNPVSMATRATARVALRKESVDRNDQGLYKADAKLVALRKESVDRNAIPQISTAAKSRRSPQGERG